MNEIVAVIESFGEYIFLGVLAVIFLNLGGALSDRGGLRSVFATAFAAKGVASHDSGDSDAAPSSSPGEHHAVLSGLLIVVGLWGLGIAFNAVCYGALECSGLHHGIIAQAYSDSSSDGSVSSDPRTLPADEYLKRSVRDEVVWRTESKEAAESMLSRSRLRVVRGALVAAPLFALAWLIGRIPSKSIAPWVFRCLCLGLIIPLFFGYQTLESQYHLAARFGEAEVSPRTRAEVAKLNAETGRLESEKAKLDSATSKSLAETNVSKPALDAASPVEVKRDRPADQAKPNQEPH